MKKISVRLLNVMGRLLLNGTTGTEATASEALQILKCAECYDDIKLNPFNAHSRTVLRNMGKKTFAEWLTLRKKVGYTKAIKMIAEWNIMQQETLKQREEIDKKYDAKQDKLCNKCKNCELCKEYEGQYTYNRCTKRLRLYKKWSRDIDKIYKAYKKSLKA